MGRDTRPGQILIGHYGDCRRPDPARYIHRYDILATLNGQPVNVDMCPGCDQYVLCQQTCWDERKTGHLAEQANRADAARRAAERARQQRADRRFTLVTLALIAGAVLCIALYAHIH